jgi:hypothetical protein
VPNATGSFVGGLLMIAVGAGFLLLRSRIYAFERWLSGAPHEYEVGKARRAWNVGLSLIFIGVGVLGVTVGCVQRWR